LLEQIELDLASGLPFGFALTKNSTEIPFGQGDAEQA
jgi:hypothetical protein